jgi:hypothetical protein
MKLIVLGCVVLLACGDAREASETDAVPTPADEQPQSPGSGNAAAPDATAARCRGDARIAGDRVGDVRIGAAASDVRRDCHVVADTMLTAEGEQLAALLVALGSDTILAELLHDSIFRIRVRSPGLATHDSLRVGVPARQLAGLRDAVIATGEGNTVVLAEAVHCGNSFGLEGLPVRTRRPWTAADLTTMPDSTHVGWILATGGCHSR